MIIGRQVRTEFGGIIDLLAIAPDCSLVLIEIKRDRTPREIVAQTLDYASWVDLLTSEQIAAIYHQYTNGENLSKAFQNRYGVKLDEESLNESHQLIIVASTLDDSTERIINYLNARDIAVNAVFFQVFEFGGDQLLSRAWLIDPGETQSNVAVTAKGDGAKEPWNGEFYVSFGPVEHRSWDEARKFGYVSAGGGSWYSQTLKQLSPGDRIWVKIPHVGYVGVGRVTQSMVPITEFRIQTPNGPKDAIEVLQHGDRHRLQVNDPEKAEYYVGVEWLDTVPTSEAVQEVGLFGNQNTVCQPKTPKWRHTVERLKLSFPNWNAVPRVENASRKREA